MKNFKTVLKPFSIAFMAIVLLFSCKTTTQTSKTDINQKKTTQLDVSNERTENSSEESKETVTYTVEVEANVEETIIHIKWSEPDSAGRQYPLETTQTDRSTQAKEQSNTTSEKEESARSKTSEKNTDNSTFESDYKSETDVKKEEKTRLPTWVYIACIVGSLLIIGVITAKWKRLF